MSQRPASKETIENLYKNMGLNFSLFVPLFSTYTQSLEQIDIVNSKNEKESSFSELLLKLNSFCLLISLDLSAFMRADFRSTSNPEKRCNLKYINVILIEGYSYLFGFRKQKKYALWSIFKEKAEKINDKDLINDINNIEQQAIAFRDIYVVKKNREDRNLSIHYDSDPQKVYGLLLNISEEIEAKKTSAFLEILLNINIFINNHIQKFHKPIFSNTKNIDIWEKINHFNDKDNKLFNELESSITSYSNQLDSIISKCRTPKKVQEKLELDDRFIDELTPLIESVNPSIHILFIYLDLASAVRAYLSSEFYIEKQLNLRRIHIVVYEGFKHIYGYSDQDIEQSFWSCNISAILKTSTDIRQLNKLENIEKELEELASDKEINNLDLRECVVHYKYKERDNVHKLFHTLVKSNPLIEMTKALKLLNLLPQLLEINTDSIRFIYNEGQVKTKLTNNKTIEQLDFIISMTQKVEMEPTKKQKFIEKLDKMKNQITQL